MQLAPRASLNGAVLLFCGLSLWGAKAFLVPIQRPLERSPVWHTRSLPLHPSFSNAGVTIMNAAQDKASEEGAAPDDVMNTVPFLTKRREALEKEVEKLEVTIESLDEQFKNFEEEWSKNINVMQNDYDVLKNRYYNDTLEAAMDGKATVFMDILATIDDFERAKMAFKPENDRQVAIVERYEQVKEKMVGALLSQGMEEVETVGETFDFMFHDCLFTEDSMEYGDGVITREFAKGFKMGGKCMRPAKVATSRGPGPN